MAIAVFRYRLPGAYLYVMPGVHRRPAQRLRWVLHAECVRAAAMLCAGTAFLVFSVAFLEIHHVHTPNDDWLLSLKRLCRIHKIAPNDVPAGMVVVRLYLPRAFAAFAF